MLAGTLMRTLRRPLCVASDVVARDTRNTIAPTNCASGPAISAGSLGTPAGSAPIVSPFSLHLQQPKIATWYAWLLWLNVYAVAPIQSTSGSATCAGSLGTTVGSIPTVGTLLSLHLQPLSECHAAHETICAVHILKEVCCCAPYV